MDSPEELQALSASYEAEFQKYYEFGERIKERLSCARADQMASAVQPGDSVSQHNATSAANKSHLSDGSSLSRLSVKIKVAKAEKAIAQLKLRQLGRKLELQRKWDAVHRGERELLEAENKLERATLKAHILKEDDGQSQLYPHEADKECDLTQVQAPLESPYLDKRPSSRTFSSDSEDTKAVPGIRDRVPLNSAASEWKGGPHLSIPAAKPHEDVPSHDEKIRELLQQHQRTTQLQQQTFQSMTSTIRQGFALSKHELSKFVGNPLEFWNFIRTFESNIETKVKSYPFFFSIVLGLHETLSRAVFQWILFLVTKSLKPC